MSRPCLPSVSGEQAALPSVNEAWFDQGDRAAWPPSALSAGSPRPTVDIR